MAFIIFKLFITAGFIVLITEIARRSDKFGGMVAALPLTTLLVIFWMHFEVHQIPKSPTILLTRYFFSRLLCRCLFCSHG